MGEPQETSAGETGGREANGSPLCDRISDIADQLEASITDLRGLPGVSRPRVVLAAAVSSLRNIAERVLEQESELDDERERAETAERELAEMRGRTPGAREQWAVRYGNGDTAYVASETQARIKANVDLAIVAVVKRAVGEWEVADGG